MTTNTGTNPYTIINTCDAEGNYILFNTNSSQKTRDWSRASSSGRLFCCSDSTKCGPAFAKLVSKKRKMLVLKYRNDNNQGPGQPKRTLNRTMIGKLFFWGN